MDSLYSCWYSSKPAAWYQHLDVFSFSIFTLHHFPPSGLGPAIPPLPASVALLICKALPRLIFASFFFYSLRPRNSFAARGRELGAWSFQSPSHTPHDTFALGKFDASRMGGRVLGSESNLLDRWGLLGCSVALGVSLDLSLFPSSIRPASIFATLGVATGTADGT